MLDRECVTTPRYGALDRDRPWPLIEMINLKSRDVGYASAITASVT
jgi:hypothetical protein